MNRRLLAGSAALVALLGTALWLRPDGSADAAPGDVDLEVTAVGTYDDSADPGSHTGALTIAVTNDPNGTEITTTAEAVEVAVNVDTADGNLDHMEPHGASTGSYDGATWVVGDLDPGQTETLTLYPVFTAGGSGSASVSPEVVAQVQNDLDSSPSDGGLIGDQDDEAVYRIADVDDALPFTGTAWNDIDDDGTQGPMEPGVADTIVRVQQGGETLYAGGTADDGSFTYAHLPDGSTDVDFLPINDFIFGVTAADPEADGSVTALAVSADPASRVLDVPLLADADLLLEKTPQAETGIAGSSISYEVRVSNGGPGATDGVEVVDDLPPGAVLDEDSIVDEGATYDEDEHTITWSAGFIAADDTAVLTYDLSFPILTPGTYSNTAQVTASSADDPDSVPGASEQECGGEDDCDVASILIGADPEPTGDSAITPEGVPVTFNVLDNDQVFGRDAGEQLPVGWTWARTSAPAQGSVTCETNGDCTYTPTEGYAGPDSFTYELTTPTALTDEITVSLESLFVNDAPVAIDDRVTTGVGATVPVDVLANDLDANLPDDELSVVDTGDVSPPEAGDLTCAGTDPCTFAVDDDFEGTATVTYDVEDSGDSDDRVDDPDVPGGVTDDTPLGDTATLTVVVDPDLLPTDTGFTGGTGDTTEAETAAWAATTVAAASASCDEGTPEVSVTWEGVDRADAYLVERQADGAGSWYVLVTVDEPTTSFLDVAVGEGHTYGYRVTPMAGLWAGTPSEVATAAVDPVQTTEDGC
jgi:hypothetical protein